MAKKKKEEPKFINEVRCLKNDTGVYRYNIKSITELEPGTIFGAIFRPQRALGVLPKLVDTEEGYKSFDFSESSHIVHLEIQDDTVATIPMIFKKLDGNLVEDILTGIQFIIGDVEPFKVSNNNEEYTCYDDLNASINKYVEIESVGKALKDFRKVPIVFDSFLFAEVGQHYLSNVALVVNDEFKAYYAQKVLSRKDDVIKGLQTMYEDAKYEYEKALDECLSQLHDIAITERFLDDIGYGLKKEK